MLRAALRLKFALLFVAVSAGRAQQLGPEFQVNTYTSDYQADPAACIAADGSFVVVWRSNGEDGDEGGVFGQRYDVSGNAQGSAFQVNTYTSEDQSSPEVCCGADGGFVVVWESYEEDGDLDGIFGQRFSAAGGTLGGQFQVNSYTTDYQTDVRICCANNSFVVVWESQEQDDQGEAIMGQRYSYPGGTPLGGEFMINTYTDSDQEDAGLCCAPDGAFVVAWESEEGQDGANEGVFAQRFAAGGSPSGGEFQVNTFTSSFQDNPALCCGADGGFVVAWESSEQDGDYEGVFAQRYGNSGTALGSEFQVNTYTSAFQGDPAICCGSEGFVIAWESGEQDGDAGGAFAQDFNGAGAAVGAEFQVNAYTSGGQFDPAIACGPQDRMLAVWESTVSDQDGDDAGVFARLSSDPLTILEIPTLAPTGLLALAALLGAGALIALRRR